MKRQRVRALVTGVVQGIGFRPFVYHLANQLQLSGAVYNSPQGVSIELEGSPEPIAEFFVRLRTEKPVLARIETLAIGPVHSVESPETGGQQFVIGESAVDGERSALVLPDLATCTECLREMFDPDDRRYLYPFTNCTYCGPRFSIIRALPYDRANTSMASFEMCSECVREFGDPDNRRFHAQPNACPTCGPQLSLQDATGRILAERHDALLRAAAAIRSGQIVALKGIGGFQLLVDARDEAAVKRLRTRKHREEKPFAVLFPTLRAVRSECVTSPIETQLLTSAQAPIVLLARRAQLAPLKSEIADAVAPRNPHLGVMLPYSPLHHVLLRELECPVVATSGNLSSEPICIDEQEACQRLTGIADLFLVHNRRILRAVDDSVVSVVLGQEMILRRARGYAPLPVRCSAKARDPGESARCGPIVALGAHLKNTVALGIGSSIFISQHIGDLESEQAHAAFDRAAVDLPALYNAKPRLVACDLHPDYLSTQRARQSGLPLLGVQHHYAHVLSCMAENDLNSPLLGVAWDGTGLGTDGTIWGGEFLLVTDVGFRRIASFRTFPLPGGDASVREPRRTAVGCLYEIFGADAFNRLALPSLQNFSNRELKLLQSMLRNNVNCPRTSSAGRLFDAVASLAGLRQKSSFEGDAAMQLEFAASKNVLKRYPFDPPTASAGGASDPAFVIDWEPILRGVLCDIQANEPIAVIAAGFHNSLAEIIGEVAQWVGERNVVLTGGCFQNKLLLELAVRRLRARGLQPYWHRCVPPNDGGIAFGQIIAAKRMFESQGKHDQERASETPTANKPICV